MKIIYHKGTGTWFAADDGVVLIDTDDLPTGTDDLIDLLEKEGDHIAEAYAQRLVTAPYMNLIFMDALSLRIEAEEKLNAGAYSEGDEDALRWACEIATDADLNHVGQCILNNDETWEWFNYRFWDGINEGYADYLKHK